MRLLGCHIDNFGAFHEYDLTFNDGLNVVLQRNGWGKTTLAAFVKAMLYGFDGKRVRNVAENERLRYKPWQGGKYGGSLDFEVGKREYRIIRTFGTTGSRDTLKVINMLTGGSALKETGANVGEWLFGLDANAFQKSVYMVRNGLDLVGSNASLRNRLNALINEADDVAGFEKAQAALESRRKFYTKIGNRGAIADASREIARLVELDSAADARIRDLHRIDAEIADYSSSLRELDEQITVVRKEVELGQAVAQRVDALRKVEERLRANQQAAQSAYRMALDEAGGLIPDSRTLNEARRNIAEIYRLGEEISRTQLTADVAKARQRDLATKYSGNMPQMRELQNMRTRIASLRLQEVSHNASVAGRSEEYGRFLAIMQSDPGLPERAEAAVTQADEILALAADGKNAAQELQTARTAWTETRKGMVSLLEEYEEKAANVPEGALTEARELRQAARELREANEQMAGLVARLDAIEANLLHEQSRLNRLPGDDMGNGSDLVALNAAVEACARVTRSTNEARSVRDNCAEKLRVMEDNVRELRAHLEEARKAEQQVVRRPSVPSIACFVAAAVVGISGMLLAPAILTIAAVLVALGLVLLVRKKTDAVGGADAELLRAVSEAETNLEEMRTELGIAEKRLTECETTARETNAALMDIVTRLFPGEDFDSSTIVAQVPVLKDRLRARSEQVQRVKEMKGQVTSIEAELAEIRAHANAITAMFTCAEADDYMENAAIMEARASELEQMVDTSSEARNRLMAAVAREMGTDVDELNEVVAEDYLTALKHTDPPKAEELIYRESVARNVSEQYASELSDLLEAFGSCGVDASELAVGVERLSRELAAYRNAVCRQQMADEQLSVSALDIADETKRIDAWASAMGVDGIEALTDEWFDSATTDVANAEQSKQEERQACVAMHEAQQAIDSARARLDSFFAAYGMEDVSNIEAGFNRLNERAEEMADLKKSLQLAESELKRWLAENGDEMKSSETVLMGRRDGGCDADRLGMLERQRDAIVRDKAKCEEQRSSVLESLENRLAVRQDLELLSKRKQKATTNLFTIQKTSEYLRSAREDLDGRYLGDLAERFDDYANAWLEGEGVDAAVSPDFDVQLYEGKSAHDVAAYSAGYRDLLDLCFRMALVDTMFQAERPFLIMDDPFASMDAEKICGAFLLLQSLAQKYQIVYFTCHPSRTMEQAANGVQTKFALPEQRSPRELPHVRAKREAIERANAQTKLVASYAVVSVAKGHASIVPDSRRRSINSNLLSVKFVVDNSTGSGDNSFEVHFIDDKGRVLCDRQTVEVIDGRTVPEKVRFSLATRDDSGDTYDMIIHENGRGPSELAARIPYSAEVAFATEDFDF